MGSLALPSQRQNMNTVPFVKRPLLSNRVPCVRPPPQMCVRRDGILGMLAETNGMSFGTRVCVCVCGGGRVRMFEWGASDESRTLPQYFVWVYLFKRVVASSRNTACACASVSEEGEECPARTQLSKHIPVSCLAPLLSRRNNFTWIYLFILPRPGPTSALSCMSSAAGGTVERRTRKKGWKETPRTL